MKQLIGISLSSQNTCVGVLKGSNVDIILSETSNRCVPTLVSFAERSRNFGDQAQSTIKSNFQKTVSYPNRWLGIHPDWPIYKEESKFATAVPVVDKNNRVGFEIGYKGEQEIYAPEHIMGVFFNKLKQNWIKAGYETKEVVVSVPDYYTSQERKALIDSLHVADLTCSSLLNESSAIALNYGIFRRNQFEDTKPRIVGFVDMGQSKTTIFFASFTKNNQKVISVTSERFCGAREFDYLLMEHFCEIFRKKYGTNPMNSPKCRLRLQDAIAKTRKILTGNREAALNVESLIDDDDLNAILTRVEFEKIIVPVLEKFKALLKTALTNAMNEASKYLILILEFTLTDLHSVEMVGDAVRTPIVQESIKEVFGLDVSKTLLPDECIARGSTLFAAMLNPHFSLKDFNFEHYNPYTVILEYPFLSKNNILIYLEDGQIQIRQHKIINKGENIPNRKTIKFTEKQTPKQEVVQLKFYYMNEELSFLSNNLLKTYMASIPHVKEEQWTFVVHFYLDSSGLPHLDKASINEIYYEEAPVKPATTTQNKDATTNATPETTEVKPEEKKVEKVKKERSTVCIVKLVESLIGIPQNDLNNIVQKEANMENDDRLLNYAINKRNEVENFIYSTRSKLDADLAAFVSNEEKSNLLVLMLDMENWLYSGDEAVYNKNVLEEKGKGLNDLGSAVYKRYHDWGRLADSLAKFDNTLNTHINRLNGEFEKIKTNKEYYLAQTEADQIAKIITEYNNLLIEIKGQFSSAPKFQDSPVKFENVDKAIDELNKKCSAVYAEADKRYQQIQSEMKKKLEELKKAADLKQAENAKMNTDTPDANATENTPNKTDLNMDVD